MCRASVATVLTVCAYTHAHNMATAQTDDAHSSMGRISSIVSDKLLNILVYRATARYVAQQDLGNASLGKPSSVAIPNGNAFIRGTPRTANGLLAKQAIFAGTHGHHRSKKVIRSFITNAIAEKTSASQRSHFSISDISIFDMLPPMLRPRLRPGHELPIVPPVSEVAYPGPLSSEQVAEFYEKGVVVVKGLLKGEQLERARQKTFDQSQIPIYESLAFDAWKIQEDPFFEIATQSPLVEAAAQLTPNAVDEGLYVLKDAFFINAGTNQGCGWHIDDEVFWPATHQEPGLNIWVVLDEVTNEGGGLAFAPGSHREEFIGARDAIRNQHGVVHTCSMAEIAPDWAEKLEAMKEVPTLQPGDAIIQTRYLFHRADPFKEGSAAQLGPGIARYSVRYVPGNTRLDGGFAASWPRREGGPVPLKGEIRHAAANGFPLFPEAFMQRVGPAQKNRQEPERTTTPDWFEPVQRMLLDAKVAD